MQDESSVESPSRICGSCGVRACERMGQGRGWRSLCSRCRKRQLAENRRNAPLCTQCQSAPCSMLTSRAGYADRCHACLHPAPRIPREWTSSSSKSKHRKHRLVFLRAFGPPAACSRCGFVPEHPCQIDIDHVNGDHSNNHPNNLQPLCANCHRLKSLGNDDWRRFSDHPYVPYVLMPQRL